MNGSLSQFRAILQRSKQRKEKGSSRFDKKRFSYNDSNKKPEYDFPVLTKSELERIKGDIRLKLKTDRMKNYILTILIICVFTGFLFYLLY